MKERIVLEKHEMYKLLDCLPMQMITDEDLEKEIKEGRKLILFGKERKVEQVPENWGDFLELCKTLKKVFISANGYYVEFNKLRFYMDGTIEFNGLIIKIVVGVSRMWQIIKNLIGEE